MDLPLAKTDFGPAAKELVKRVLDWWEPGKVRAMAKAEADAMVTKAEAEMTIENTRRTRALNRLIQDQEVLEEVVHKAIPLLKDSAQPAEISPDWLKNFTDKARLAGDDDVKEMWSRVLAGQVNSPGRFSKRTVNFLAEIEKAEAESFIRVCAFRVSIWQSEPTLLIFNTSDPIYKNNGASYTELERLSTLGLISIVNHDASYLIQGLPSGVTVEYDNQALKFSSELRRGLGTGRCRLTELGNQLAQLCTPVPVNGFFDYLFNLWQSQGGKIERMAAPPVKVGPINRSSSVQHE